MEFIKVKPLQTACSLECAIVLANMASAKRAKKIAKIDRAAVRQARDGLKSRANWMAEAQSAFNRWIRLRDHGMPCISCGRMHQGQIHAGHYRTTKAAPELRFHPDNVHAQCAPCNTHLSGNLIEYRIGLITRIGLASVDWLEGPHDQAKYTIDELREIRDGFRAWAREMER
jgi:hypothetical protein